MKALNSALVLASSFSCFGSFSEPPLPDAAGRLSACCGGAAGTGCDALSGRLVFSTVPATGLGTLACCCGTGAGSGVEGAGWGCAPEAGCDVWAVVKPLLICQSWSGRLDSLGASPP